MRVLVIVVVIVTWESKANSSSSLTELKTGTELGNYFISVSLNFFFQLGCTIISTSAL